MILPSPLQWIGAALVALVASLAVAFFSPAGVAYLAAFTFAASIPLGSAAVLMLFRLTGGAWGEAIRFRLEAATSCTPLLLLLFVPIGVGARRLYPGELAGGGSLGAWSGLLPAAALSALVLIFWAICGPVLAGSSRRVREGEQPGRRLRAWCAAGLIVYFLTVTFTFTPWLASLQPHWHSSIFGVIIVCSQGLTALAFATLGTLLGPRAQRPAPDSLRDIGSLILALSLLHIYVAFSQFFIIWNGDVTSRTAWYIPRSRGFWLVIVIAAVALQWALPFTAMLFRAVKTRRSTMIAVGATLLLAAVLEAAWITLPSSREDGVLARVALVPLAAAAFAAFVLPRRRDSLGYAPGEDT